MTVYRSQLPRLMTWLVAIMITIVSGPAAFGLSADEMFADAAKEERAREIGRSLRCLVCQNQSIFDSNAALAKDLRVLVRQRMEAGDTDDEVIDYVAARYGDYVLLEPPVDTHTYVLWLAPLAFVVTGVGVITAYLLGRRRRQPAEPLQAEERAAARQILTQDRA